MIIISNSNYKTNYNFSVLFKQKIVRSCLHFEHQFSTEDYLGFDSLFDAPGSVLWISAVRHIWGAKCGTDCTIKELLFLSEMRGCNLSEMIGAQQVCTSEIIFWVWLKFAKRNISSWSSARGVCEGKWRARLSHCFYCSFDCLSFFNIASAEVIFS